MPSLKRVLDSLIANPENFQKKTHLLVLEKYGRIFVNLGPVLKSDDILNESYQCILKTNVKKSLTNL